MKKVLAVVALIACAHAQADVWKWVDAKGDTHFVDTNTPIYTWVDDSGDVHYSDTPDHEDAVSVELIWVSNKNLDDAADSSTASGSGYAHAGETPADRAEREAAEAYYCKRATEIYESYANAPKLYKTDENGERVYLTDAEAKQTIDETRAKKDELCG